MDILDGISLNSVLVAANGWLAITAKAWIKRWLERRRYRHFRKLIFERAKDEVKLLYAAVVRMKQTESSTRLSDLVISALIDAGFVADEVERLTVLACHDTRGRFARLTARMAGDEFGKNVVDVFVAFFELRAHGLQEDDR